MLKRGFQMGESYPVKPYSGAFGKDVLEHELANVLNGLNGMVQLLQSSGLNGEQRRWLTAIEQSGRQLHRLVEYARIQDSEGGHGLLPDIRLLDGMDFLEHVVISHSPAATAAGCRLLLYAGTGLATSWNGDRCMLLQLMDNLVGNAIKFGAGGDVIVGAGAGSGNELELTVQDSGPGIGEAIQHRVLNPYYRAAGTAREQPGQGLGLYVCRQIVDSLGGTMRLLRPAAGGTRWVVVIPGMLEPPAAVSRGIRALAGLHCQLQLDPLMTRSVSGLLDRMGVNWSNCESGGGPISEGDSYPDSLVVRLSAASGNAGLVLTPSSDRDDRGAGSRLLPAPILESILAPALLRLVLERNWKKLNPGGKPGSTL